MPPLAALMLLFAALYAAFGVSSPFLPALMESRGLTAEQIGLLFGCGTAARLMSAPLAGRIADTTSALRMTLAVFCAATALTTLCYAMASGFWPLFAVGLLHAVALAPTTNIADAIAVGAARRHGFEYGWVRGSASAAFIAASVAAGAAVYTFGLPVIVVLQAALMMTVPALLTTVPAVSAQSLEHKIDREGVGLLLRSALFRRVFCRQRWSSAVMPCMTHSRSSAGPTPAYHRKRPACSGPWPSPVKYSCSSWLDLGS